MSKHDVGTETAISSDDIALFGGAVQPINLTPDETVEMEAVVNDQSTQPARGPGYWDCDCGRECHHKEGPRRLPDCRAEWVEWRNDELDAALNARHERKTQPADVRAEPDADWHAIWTAMQELGAAIAPLEELSVPPAWSVSLRFVLDCALPYVEDHCAEVSET